MKRTNWSPAKLGRFRTNSSAATASNGSDTYVWTKGDGNDTINDWGQSLLETDTLELTDVVSTDVALSYSASAGADLLVTILSTGEVIRIDERYQNTAYGHGIERITFSDGVTWNLTDLLDRARLNGDAAANTLTGTAYRDNLYGLDGNDALNGNDGNDMLVGGFGTDSLNGGNGSDTYAWSKGDGNDTINDTGASVVDVDILYLSNAIAADVNLYRQSGLSNLRVAIATGPGTSSEILVTDHFLSTTSGVGIEGIRFADGIMWSRSDIVARTGSWGTASAGNSIGSANNDRIFGGDGNDTLNGNDGDDHLRGDNHDDSLVGGNGSDTYEWSKGHGNDTINDTGASLLEIDRLWLKNVASTDLLLTRANGSSSLTVKVISTGETITVLSRFGAVTSGAGIEQISFSDGVLWTLQDILARTRVEGTAGNDALNGVAYRDNIFGLSGNDTLTGNDGDDLLVGGLGVDALVGGNGSDLYQWKRGDGNDTINDAGTIAGEVDTLILTDVASTGALLGRSGVNLTVTVPQTSEVITVLNRFATTGGTAGVEAIEFSDGVVTRILQDQVALFATTGTINGDTLNGTIYADSISGLAGADTINTLSGNDTIIGGTGNDLLQGGDGSDSYYWAKGDGSDNLQDLVSSAGSVDTLYLTNVVSTDVVLTRVTNLGAPIADDLRITILSTGEVLNDSDRFVTGSRSGMERIVFANGVVWDLEEIYWRTEFVGTTAAETLSGTARPDNM